MADSSRRGGERTSTETVKSSPMVSNKDKDKESVKGKGKASTKSTDKSDEIMAVLQAMRSEQNQTNKKLDDYGQRLKDMESARDQTYEMYPTYDYDYDSNYGQGYEEYGSYDDCLMATPSLPVGSKRKADDNNNDTLSAHGSESAVSEQAGSSRFAGLAKRFKTVEVCDKEIDPVLASNINELFRKGMEDEQYMKMVKDEENPRPSNCDSLVTVKLNQLVWDIVSPAARTRDKKLQQIETSLVKSASVLVKTVDKAAKFEKDNAATSKASSEIDGLIDGCNDAVALMGHANRQINLLRRDLLKPEMRNEYAHLCTHTLPYTSQLFGDDVSKTAKEIEECSRIGYKLQYGPVRGSFRGRPSFRPRFRGGSRGFRGRGAYGDAHQQYPKNSPRRGGNRRM